MSDTEHSLTIITQQWSVLFLAKYILSSELPPKEKEARIYNYKKENSKKKTCPIDVERAAKIASTEAEDLIDSKLSAVNNELLSFHKSKHFPKMFTDLMTYTHDICTFDLAPISKEQKPKSLHTEAIIGDEHLTKTQLLECTILVHLAKIVSAASEDYSIDFSQIDVSIIRMIFTFMNHDLPNSVRASAGTIISALSVSPPHLDQICDYFWKTFAACKKDDDFRNFASMIDGVVGLKLSIGTDALTESSMRFLRSFIGASKKIERGVLRMKFLDALVAIIGRICSNPISGANKEFIKVLDDIWNIVVKWSSKSKHTSFCYTFLCGYLKACFPPFYLAEHGKKFCELLCKYAKGGDVEMLNLLAEFIKISPKEFTLSRVDEFQKMADTFIFPILFSGNPPKRSIRFKEPNQIEAVTQILTELGVQSISVIMDFVRTTLAAEKPNDDHKKVRLVSVNALSRLAERAPNALEQRIDELHPVLEPILLQSAPGSPAEIPAAIRTFPLVHSPNETKLAQISQILFDYTTGTDAALAEVSLRALTDFISEIVTLSSNAMLPLNFLEKLLENICVLKPADAVRRLDLIAGIAGALVRSLSVQTANFKAVRNGSSAMTSADWVGLRLKLDRAMIPLLFSGESEVVEGARKAQEVLVDPAICAMDKAVSDAPFYLSNWLKSLKERETITDAVETMIEKAPENANAYFEGVLDFWRTNRNRLNPQQSQKILYFTAAIARKEGQPLKIFFEELFKVFKETPASTEIPHALGLLHPSLWMALIIELNQWMGTSGLTSTSFWPQYVSIYYAFATRADFGQQVKEQPKIAETYERFLISFWKGAAKSCGSFAPAEKCFRILQIYVENSEARLSRIVDTTSGEAFAQFTESLIGLVDLANAGMFSETYVEAFLNTLNAVFTYEKLPVEVFESFGKWLSEFSLLFYAKEQVQLLTAQLLSTILIHNAPLLRHFFRLSLAIGPTALPFILAIANTYQAHPDMSETYENAGAVLLATILTHIQSDEYPNRQAALKLVTLTTTRPQALFTVRVPVELTMTMASESNDGLISQYNIFVEFAARSVSESLAFGLMKVFAEDLGIIEAPHSRIISELIPFIPKMVAGSTLEAVLPMMLQLSTHTNIGDAQVMLTVQAMWSAIFSAFREVLEERPTDLIKIIFEFGVNQDSMTSSETAIAILVLVNEFGIFPEETTDFLIPYLTRYSRAVPDGLNEFCDFLAGDRVSFEVSDEEVVAYNALSQILFLVDSKEQFEKLFVPRLPQLVYYATMNYHLDTLRIGKFQPLLDSILDAALFRFADPQLVESNLETLQKSSLIRRATSLRNELQIHVDMPANQLLCYDREAIASMADLLCQMDAEFKRRFFSIVFAHAISAEKGDRSMEPFIVMMGLGDMLSTKVVFQLLLFALFAFKTGRTELMDSLVDNINQRLLSDIPEEEFEAEALPVLIVFILSLSLDLKRSFSVHLMKVIADIAQKICQATNARDISSGIVDFMKHFNGDEYIASLFKRFIDDVPTFADQSVLEVTRALYALSKLIGLSEPAENWCLLFATLIDGTRALLGVINGRPQPRVVECPAENAEEFAAHLAQNFKSERQQQFVVKFTASLIRNFKTQDLHVDTIAAQVTEGFLRLSGAAFPAPLTDDLTKFLFLLSLTCDTHGRNAASAAVAWLIQHLDHPLDAGILSIAALEPKFITVKRKPIGHYLVHERSAVDPQTLPQFALFGFSGMEMGVIIDTLWQYISSKLGERMSMPDFKAYERRSSAADHE